MSALSEANYVGDWLKYEADPNYCREAGSLASGQDLASGTVLSYGTTTWSAFVHDDGTFGTAEGILVEAVDATSAAKACVVLVRGPAIISKSELAWHADNDTTEIAIGLASLLATNGIVARD